MKCLCTLVAGLGLALPALAQSAESVIPFDADHVRYVNIGPGQPGARGELFYYSNFMPAYFNTGSTPRWHTGDVITLNPPGVTNALVDTVKVGLVPTLGPAQSWDVRVRFFNTFDNTVAPPGTTFLNLIGGFFFNTGPIDQGFIYLFTVDISALPGGGITLPDDSVAVDITNAVTGSIATPPLVGYVDGTWGFANSGLAGPDVGLSDDFYLRDVNADGNLASNEQRFFGGPPNIANTAMELSNRSVTVEPTGRCCLTNGCQVLTQAACTTAGGSLWLQDAPCFNPGPTEHAYPRPGVNIAIPDNDPVGIADSVTVPGGDNYTVGDIHVDVDIPDHTFIGDLRISLENGPTRLALYNGVCGNQDGITITFHDGSPPIVCATPTTGEADTAQSMATMLGRAANANGGVWTLHVADVAAIDIGTLMNWSLRLHNAISNCPPQCSCTGDINTMGTSNGVIDLSDLTALLSAFGGPVPTPCYDLNPNGTSAGVVDLSDLTLLLSRFGTHCN